MSQITASVRRTPRIIPGKKPATTALAGKAGLEWDAVGMGGVEALVWEEAGSAVLAVEAVGDVEEELVDEAEERVHMPPEHVYPSGQQLLPHCGSVTPVRLAAWI
jgi:hypothetical protein